MSGVYVGILIFLVVALVALVVVWVLARRMKSDLDTSPSSVAGARTSLELGQASVARLRDLSVEPILLKQNEEGVRVQIEHRPMLPLMAFVGKDVSAALNEAAMKVSEQWGPRWVVLLTAGEDGSVTAQRLA
ncbi:MAG: hypothetical protein ACM3MJ_03075 [Deltaproteobacteria bacterium]